MENYQKKLDTIIEDIIREESVPTLILHSCCAPCSSYCIEYLSNYFKITVFYYNPNIYPDEEYFHRVKEQQRFIKEFPTKYPVSFIEGDYDKNTFYEKVKGYEKCEEGGDRCTQCFELRLGRTLQMAEETGADYFATTLTISPMKNAEKLNNIGYKLAENSVVKYLPSDFKKRNGYKRSTEISNEYGMYRQNYCGCVFSVRE